MNTQDDTQDIEDTKAFTFERIMMFSKNLVNILDTIVENSRLEFVSSLNYRPTSNKLSLNT